MTKKTDRVLGIDDVEIPESKSYTEVSDKDKRIIGIFVSELVATVSNFSIDEAQGDLVSMFEKAREIAKDPNPHLDNKPESSNGDEVNIEEQLKELFARD